MSRTAIVLVILAALLGGCGHRGLAAKSHHRAERLGLADAEADAFEREVAACVRREQARASAPREPTSAPAATDEPGAANPGTAPAVGAAAASSTDGIARRWWKRIRRRAARTAEPGAASSAAPQSAANSVGPNTPVAAADTPPDHASRTVVDACLETVTARWRAHRPELAPEP